MPENNSRATCLTDKLHNYIRPILGQCQARFHELCQTTDFADDMTWYAFSSH